MTAKTEEVTRDSILADMERSDLAAELLRDGRNFGPGRLWDAWASGRTDRATLPAVILDVWSAAEYPEYQLSRPAWLTLFRSAGYVTDPPGLAVPRRSLTIFRGANPRHSHGMAWTLDRTVAQQFADRWTTMNDRIAYQLAESGRRPSPGPGHVYTATIPPRGVLARIESDGLTWVDGALVTVPHGEREVLVNPALLRDVRRTA